MCARHKAPLAVCWLVRDPTKKEIEQRRFTVLTAAETHGRVIDVFMIGKQRTEPCDGMLCLRK
jgi:hypothetical protein